MIGILGFQVLMEDFNPEFHPYDEEHGIVATAFKRSFPGFPFVRAHGDYYIGLGKKNDYVRYEFLIADQKKIQRLFDLKPTDHFEPFILTTYKS